MTSTARYSFRVLPRTALADAYVAQAGDLSGSLDEARTLAIGLASPIELCDEHGARRGYVTPAPMTATARYTLRTTTVARDAYTLVVTSDESDHPLYSLTRASLYTAVEALVETTCFDALAPDALVSMIEGEGGTFEVAELASTLRVLPLVDEARY